MVIVGVANAFAPNYYVFIVLRLFTGILYEVGTPTFEIFLRIFLLTNTENYCRRDYDVSTVLMHMR